MLPYESKSKLETDILKGKINIRDILPALNVKDIRTALSWCKKKGLFVIPIGKERYINFIDFELVVDLPFIKSLKLKFPSSWKEIYDAYKKRDYITIAEQMLETEKSFKEKFVVQGIVANSFIKTIKQNLKGNGRDKTIEE